jgi:hypothetical protein
MLKKLLVICILFASLATPASAQMGLRSGLQPGQRPGPYTSIVCSGPQRGTLHCFICETADKPAVIIFARSLSDPLGKLASKLDRAVSEHKAAELRAWITFLAADQTSLDAQVVQWGLKHAVGSVPLGVFEDVVGPPTYRIAREADVTVLLSVQQKVVANYTFRKGDLTDERIEEILRALPQALITQK